VVHYKRFFELNLFGVDQILYRFVSLKNKIFWTARILQLPKKNVL
jgi:hypothetical protein